jgi:hypothetical protein
MQDFQQGNREEDFMDGEVCGSRGKLSSPISVVCYVCKFEVIDTRSIENRATARVIVSPKLASQTTS